MRILCVLKENFSAFLPIECAWKNADKMRMNGCIKMLIRYTWIPIKCHSVWIFLFISSIIITLFFRAIILITWFSNHYFGYILCPGPRYRTELLQSNYDFSLPRKTYSFFLHIFKWSKMCILICVKKVHFYMRKNAHFKCSCTLMRTGCAYKNAHFERTAKMRIGYTSIMRFFKSCEYVHFG